MVRHVVVALLSTAALLAGTAIAAPVSLATPSGEAAYADGQTYWMHSTHVVLGASSGLLSAPPIYILGFPTSQASGPLLLPSGYVPQCNPCSGEPVLYHDHLLTGEPGAGTNGTAGDYRSPWRVVIMMYNPSYAYSPDFEPITSDTQLADAERNHEFLPISEGPDPYEKWTPNVLICPLVRAG